MNFVTFTFNLQKGKYDMSKSDTLTTILKCITMHKSVDRGLVTNRMQAGKSNKVKK